MIEKLEIHSPELVRGTASFTLRADYYEGQPNLKQFRARHPHYRVLSAAPLVIEPERGAYAILTKFGSVVYWNCSEAVIAALDRELRDLAGTLSRNEAVQDQLLVRVGGDADHVTFDEVRLSDLTLEKMKIVSLVFAQSVALEHLELEVSEALRRFEPVIGQLQSEGKLVLSQKQVMQAVGFAMRVRSAVLANLTLFDRPPELWENQELEALERQLRGQFDLEERADAINKKLEHFGDVNSTLMDVLNNRKSQRLEWIIIFLILIEILIFFYIELPFFK